MTSSENPWQESGLRCWDTETGVGNPKHRGVGSIVKFVWIVFSLLYTAVRCTAYGCVCTTIFPDQDTTRIYFSSKVNPLCFQTRFQISNRISFFFYLFINLVNQNHTDETRFWNKTPIRCWIRLRCWRCCLQICLNLRNATSLIDW